MAAPQGVLQLESFVNDILKVELQKIMQQRDTIREYISQCHHLAQLFKELKALDSQTSFIAEKSRVEREHEKIKELLAQIAEMEKKDAEWKKEKVTEDVSVEKTSSNTNNNNNSRKNEKDTNPSFKNKILVDLGNHFYATGYIQNNEKENLVYMNVGCNVILPMTISEAEAFLKKKEKVLKMKLMRKTKESLRLKYRIRIVTEAITRLSENATGLSSS